MRELEESELRDLRPALEARLRRLAGDRAAPAQLYWKEVAEARAVASHELWPAIADAFDQERIEVVLAKLPEGNIVELDAAEVPPEAPEIVFTRDFKFLVAARPALEAIEGSLDATIGAPDRFLKRVEAELPAVTRRPV